MKILRNTNNNENQFHMMGLTSENFYAIKHALAAYASRAADPDKSQGMMDYEIENAIITWNSFKEEEHHCVDISAQPKPCPPKKNSTVVLIDLGLPSGTKWADRNVGADSPEASGDYFRWGETVPFTENSDEYEYRDLGKNIAGTEYDAATVNLGKGYRMPTHEQQKELLKCCTWEWTTLNGVKGMKVTGPNGNHIFFPASGYRNDSSGSLSNVGSDGYYWTATPYGTNNGRYLYFYSSNARWDSYFRALGFPVRAVA